VKARVAALAVAVLTAAGMLAVFTPGPASAQGGASFAGGASFSGYSTGTSVHADVLQIQGAPRLANADVATSGGSTDTNGVKAINNEMDEPVATANPSKDSYGRGSGAEIGLGTTVPDPAAKDTNQIILSGLAEASAPPTSDLVTKEILGTQIPGNPLLYASLLRGQAQARWSNSSCVFGAPTDYGLGYAADAQVLNTTGGNLDPTDPDPTKQIPLLSTDTNPNGEDAVQTKSFTYLRPEPDGSFAVVSEVREELAPVLLFKNMTGAQIKIDVGGEWYLRTISTGKPGGAKVEYGTTGNSTPNVNTLVSITPPGGPVQDILHVQDLFGPGKIPTQIPLGTNGQYLAIINVGEKPRAIGSDDAVADSSGNLPAPQTSADGTTTGAAVDVVRVQLVVPGTGQHIAEVRVGHMEAKSVAPSGGVQCNVPVTKTANPDPVTAGNPFTWTITIPSAPDSLAGSDCDLTNIKVVDDAKVLSGSPRANITGASNGGHVTGATVSGSTHGGVTWDNVGNYHPGGPPIVLTINGNIPSNSGAGVLQNTATVTATLGNCKGGAAGQDIVGTGTVTGTSQVTGAAVKGVAFVNGPNVKSASVLPARLAETGQKDPWLPVLGGGLLLGSLALMRSRRRLHGVRN
jgi:LPXTG-motif cell wall-anchored protein